ncbi:MAG: AzlC family ABC transporter permease [Dactylosporangium sp.]|nr:AzlC family ABC transporter permease [Dactylosporangium sp.]NNJ61140.1 AzlC family ABC transporter permease [Dactylosporangium sp.]
MAAAAGVAPELTIGMSLLVFAGGAQFLAVGVIGAGGGIAAAILAGLLLNARHLPFGLAVGAAFDRGWATRIVGSHLMIDESVAFALAQREPERRRRAYWMCGIAVFVCWNLGTALGVLAGGAVGDPNVLGLDAAFPAGLLALLLPSLADRVALRVALIGATIAVVATPLLQPGAGLLLALIALAFALPLPARRPGRRP